jgi:hypothetical protein
MAFPPTSPTTATVTDNEMISSSFIQPGDWRQPGFAPRSFINRHSS